MTEMNIATDAAVVAGILTVTQMAKKFIPQIPRKVMPWIPVVIAVIYAFLQYGTADLNTTVTYALAYGLAAGGAFRAVKVSAGQDSRSKAEKAQNGAGAAPSDSPDTPAEAPADTPADGE